MAEWFESLRDIRINGFPKDAGLYEMDALDKFSITQANTFIVKRVGDRPEEMRFALREVTVEERKI